MIADDRLVPLECARLLLDDCCRLGTLPFAHLARSGFVKATGLNFSPSKSLPISLVPLLKLGIRRLCSLNPCKPGTLLLVSTSIFFRSTVHHSQVLILETALFARYAGGWF